MSTVLIRVSAQLAAFAVVGSVALAQEATVRLSPVAPGVFRVVPLGAVVAVGVEGQTWLLDQLHAQRSRLLRECTGDTTPCERRLGNLERTIEATAARLQRVRELGLHAADFSVQLVSQEGGESQKVVVATRSSTCSYSFGAGAGDEGGCMAWAWCRVVCDAVTTVYSRSWAFASPVWNGQYWDDCWDEWEDWDPPGDGCVL